MTERSDHPAYWLRKAKDVREVAEQVSEPEMRDILEGIAKSYERISERVRHASRNLNGGQAQH